MTELLCGKAADLSDNEVEDNLRDFGFDVRPTKDGHLQVTGDYDLWRRFMDYVVDDFDDNEVISGLLVAAEARGSGDETAGGEGMTAKHTPGPWQVVSGYPPIVRGGEKDGVPDLEVTVNGRNVKADANLIAAAPDLLEAAEKALSVLSIFLYAACECLPCETCPKCDVEKQLKAAIAKARGEAQT